MNERILELAIEARKYAESKPDIYQVAYDKKFAELIVRECADLFEVEYGQSEVSGNEVAEIVKKHFGVEE